MTKPLDMDRRSFLTSLTGMATYALLQGCVTPENVDPDGATLPVANMYISGADANFTDMNVYAEWNNRYVAFTAYEQSGHLFVKTGKLNHAGGAPSYVLPFGRPTSTPFVLVDGTVEIGNASYTENCFFTYRDSAREEIYGKMRTESRTFIGVDSFAGMQSSWDIIDETLAAFSAAAGQLYAVRPGSFESGVITHVNGVKYGQADNLVIPCL